MRQLSWMLGLVLVLGLAACSSSAPSGDAQMADCCKTTADLKAQMPKCCATGGECCKKTEKADCCKKADELSAKLPACCKKQAAGEAQACCAPKK